MFSESIGDKGLVYATEINKSALSYVEKMCERRANIRPVVSALDNANLPADCADVVFMCSMYHAVYITSIEFVKDRFINSIKKALRPGGKLIIVDNDITPPDIPAYFGSAIDPRFTITQLSKYGFKLKECKRFVPQRYVLVFEREED